MLAIDRDARVFYEGSSRVGIPIVPTPFVSVATVLHSEGDHAQIPPAMDLGIAPLVFREDYFDPVTRIRRGRFYNRDDGSQPRSWTVQAHPSLPSDSRSIGAGGMLKKELFGFHDWAARRHLRETDHQVAVALGIRDAMTVWRVIAIEQISTGEDLVTLKAQSNMGVLPEIAEEKIPEGARGRVLQVVQNLVDTAYRAGPESVIDRCRDLAATVLGTYFEDIDTGASQKDLAKLGALASQQNRFVLEQSAKLIALLHARTKPSEQVRRSTTPPGDEDASLALECVGAIIREVGWTIR